MRFAPIHILPGILLLIADPTSVFAHAKAFQTASLPADSALVRTLMDLDRSLDDAYLRADKRLFELVLADDMISVSAQGDVMGKKEILGQIDQPVNMSLIATEVLVRVFGATAVVSSRKTSHSLSNPADSFQYRETNTFTMRESRWLLISSQQAEFPKAYSPKSVNMEYTMDPDMIEGNKNAEVVLIEFSDYECPHCRRFAAETFLQLDKNYIITGKVAFALHQSPSVDIHPLAFKAAEAALCAKRQGKFWEMTGALYGDPLALHEPDLIMHATSVKLDGGKFKSCLAKEETAEELRQSMAKAAELGIKGTPIFLAGVRKKGTNSVHVTRMIEGDYPYDVFRNVLDALLLSAEH